MAESNARPVIAGLFAILAAFVGATAGKIPGLKLPFFKSEFDTPAVGLTPRQEICYWHQNDPAGYRLMRRRADGVWIETQPDSTRYTHVELGHVTWGPWHGVVTRREENPRGEPWTVQLFIPDIGAHNVLLFRPSPQAGWEYVSILESSTNNCPRRAKRPDNPFQPANLLSH